MKNICDITLKFIFILYHRSSYVKDLVKQKEKFIVFAYHMTMLDALSDTMKSLKVDHIRIDGTTKQDLRSTYIDRFQTEQSCQVAVLSLKACNSAITLTAASLVVFAELDWNPSVSRVLTF